MAVAAAEARLVRFPRVEVKPIPQTISPDILKPDMFHTERVRTKVSMPKKVDAYDSHFLVFLSATVDAVDTDFMRMIRPEYGSTMHVWQERNAHMVERDIQGYVGMMRTMAEDYPNTIFIMPQFGSYHIMHRLAQEGVSPKNIIPSVNKKGTSGTITGIQRGIRLLRRHKGLGDPAWRKVLGDDIGDSGMQALLTQSALLEAMGDHAREKEIVANAMDVVRTNSPHSEEARKAYWKASETLPIANFVVAALYMKNDVLARELQVRTWMPQVSTGRENGDHVPNSWSDFQARALKQMIPIYKTHWVVGAGLLDTGVPFVSADPSRPEEGILSHIADSDLRQELINHGAEGMALRLLAQKPDLGVFHSDDGIVSLARFTARKMEALRNGRLGE